MSAPSPTEPEGAPEEERDFVRYLFWRLRPEWRWRPKPERELGRQELAVVLTHPPRDLTLRAFSLVGTKAGTQGLLWMVTPRVEALQELESRIWGTRMGSHWEISHSYLGMGRRSEYLDEHAHAGQEGGHVVLGSKPYLFVYPFVKKREWYRLPFEERRKVMGEHFRIGHKFPSVEIHTGYSFGLDDPEFILAFGADRPEEFLDLVQALRPTEASRYTELETPIFTCLGTTVPEMLELAEGRSL
jgi:chlorite dismutase